MELNLQQKYRIFSTMSHSETIQIHDCLFEATVVEAEALIRFPCRLFLSWKHNSAKTPVKSTNQNVTIINGLATFNETLLFQTHMAYDPQTQLYQPMETIISLLLVSNRKPDEQKLVGRVMADLSSVLNSGQFNLPEKHGLSFCSVKDASLKFSIRCSKCTKTNLRLSELEIDDPSHVASNPRALNLSSSTNNEDQFHFKPQRKSPSQYGDIMREYKEDPSSLNPRSKQIVSPNQAKDDPVAKMKILELEYHNKKLSTEKSQLQSTVDQNALTIKALQEEVQRRLEEQQLIQQKLKEFESKGEDTELLQKYNSLSEQYKELRADSEATIQELIQQVGEESKRRMQAEEQKRRLQEQYEERRLQEQDEKRKLQAQDEERKLQAQELAEQKQSNQIAQLRAKIAKLESQLAESEQGRIELETENLDIKYELSELKTDMDLYQYTLKQKNDEILKLQREIESQQAPNLSHSPSEMEREVFNEEVETLNMRIKELTEELTFAAHAKNKLDQLNEAYSAVFAEKQILKKEREMLLMDKELKSEQKMDYHEEQAQADAQIIAQLREELTARDDRIKALEQAALSNEKDISELVELNSKLEQQKLSLQDKLRDSEQIEAQMEQLRMECHSKTVNEEELKQKLAEDKQTIAKLQIQLQSLNKKILSKNAELQKLHEKAVKRESQASKIAEFSSQIQKLTEEKVSLLNEISSKDLSIKSLEQYTQNKDEQIEYFQSEILKFKTKLKQMEGLARKHEQQCKRLESQAHNFAQERQEYEAEAANKISDHYKLILQLKQEKGAQEEQIEKLKGRLMEKQQQESSRSLERGRSLEEQIRRNMQLEEKIHKFAEKEAKMRENILVLEEESKKIYEIVVEKEEAQDIQNQMLDEKDDEIASLKAQIGELKDKFINASEEISQLQKDLFSARREAVMRESEKNNKQADDGLKENYEKIFELNNQRIDELQNQLRQAEREKVRIEQILEDKIKFLEGEKLANERALGYQRDELKDEKYELASRVSKLEAELRDKNAKIESLREQVKANQDHYNAKYQELRLKAERSESELEQLNKLMLDQQGTQKSPSDQFSRGQSVELNKQDQQGRQIARLRRERDELVAVNEKLQQAMGQLKLDLSVTQKSLKQIKSELDDKEVEKMSIELDKQFLVVEEKRKSVGADSLRKSFSIDHHSTSQEVIQACKVLKQLIEQRAKKDPNESYIELLLSRNALMEQGIERVSEERGNIQTNARKLSMEFMKIKAMVMKGGRSYAQKQELLASFKPVEVQVNQLVTLSENLLEARMEIEVE